MKPQVLLIILIGLLLSTSCQDKNEPAPISPFVGTWQFLDGSGGDYYYDCATHPDPDSCACDDTWTYEADGTRMHNINGTTCNHLTENEYEQWTVDHAINKLSVKDSSGQLQFDYNYKFVGDTLWTRPYCDTCTDPFNQWEPMMVYYQRYVRVQ